MLNPITSQSINSPAIVKDKIAQEYRIHWFLGLRQAELYISDRLGALEYARSELQIAILRKSRLEIEIEILESIDPELSFLEKRLDELTIAEKRIEIKRLESQSNKIQYQIRDAVAELQAAQEMHSDITSQHCEEIQNMSFDELQLAFGHECIESKQAHSLCIQALAISVGQPIAEIIGSMNPERSGFVVDEYLERYSNFVNGTDQSLLKQLAGNK